MDGGGGISEAEQSLGQTCRPQEPHPRQGTTLTGVLCLRYHAKSDGRPQKPMQELGEKVNGIARGGALGQKVEGNEVRIVALERKVA